LALAMRSVAADAPVAIVAAAISVATVRRQGTAFLITRSRSTA
jgi:hypothetical protein